MKTKDEIQMEKNLVGGHLPVVAEDDSCPYWESAGGTNLAPMHECWYCKYSDFRVETKVHRTHSVCHCPENVR